jgi:hypothetical protein
MLKSTSKILQMLCLMGTLLFFSTDASATHSMGLDLTYKCVGNNQYEINLVFYRDCNGVGVGSVATVNWAAACGSGSLTLNQISMVEITPACPGIVGTACNAGGGIYGIEKYSYQGILTLPAGCTDISLSHSICCRNNAITSLSNPGGELIYVEAQIADGALCNNSPIFTNDPVPFGCVGQPVFYNHGASDVDGDDLVYSLVNCLTDANIPVGYAAGFDAVNPLSTTNGVTIDASTGAITFTPSVAQVGVFCVSVQEYRNGVLIGEIIRDIQFTAVACSNNVPTLSGVNNTTDYSAVATVGNQLCFDMFSNDLDASQSTFVSWNGGIAGGTFTASAANFAVGTFCWTPTASDVGTHTFTVAVTDNFCPIVGQNTYTYTITVPPVPACDSIDMNIVSTNDVICSSNDGSAVILASNGVAPYDYQLVNWTTGEFFTNTSGVFSNLTPGSYSVWVEDANGCTPACTGHTFVIGGNATPVTVTATAEDVNCPSNSTNVMDTTNTDGSVTAIATGGTAPYLYSIDGINFQNSDLFASLGVGTYTVIVMDANGCSATTTATVNEPAPINIAVASITAAACGLSNGSITLSASGGDGNFLYYINGQSQSSPTFTNLAAGTYTFSVCDMHYCLYDTTIVIPAGPSVVVTAVGQDVNCPSNSTNVMNSTNSDGSVTATATNGTAPYTYSINGGASFQNSNVFGNLGVGNYTVIVVDANGCSDTTTASVNEPAPINIAVVSITPETCGQANGSITLSASGGDGNFLYYINGQSQSSPTFTNLTAGTYTFSVCDMHYCLYDTTIVIPGVPAFVATASSTNPSCEGSCNGTATAYGSSSTAYTVVWSNGQTGATISNLCAGTYTATVTDANGCSSSATTTITDPTAIAVTLDASSDETCTGNDGSATLSVTGGTSPYTIDLANFTTSTTTSNGTGIFTGLNAGNHVANVTDANGCSVNCAAHFKLEGCCTAPAVMTDTRGTAGGVSLMINPNPASSLVQISYQTSESAVNITILDANGKAVYTKAQTSGTGSFEIMINDWADSFYFVVMTDANGELVKTEKLVIAK